MAGQGYLSDAAAMQRAITGFAECAANAKQTMRDLESELMSTLSAYKGEQQVQAFSLHQQLQDKMRQANTELDTMSELVNNTSRNYSTGDQNAAQSFQSLSGSVDAGGAVLGRLSGV